MFEIALWCKQPNILKQLRTLIAQQENLHLTTDCDHADIMIVNLAEEAYRLERIEQQLKQRSKHTILLVLAADTSLVLELIGIYVYQYILHQDIQQRLPNCLLHCMDYLQRTTYLSIHKGRETTYLKIRDISHFQYEDGEIYAVTTNQRIPTQYATLEKVKELLPTAFYMVNRNILVNIEAIDHVQDTECQMMHGISFAISRRRRSGLLKILQERRWDI